MEHDIKKAEGTNIISNNSFKMYSSSQNIPSTNVAIIAVMTFLPRM
jgi:hypothetical protein